MTADSGREAVTMAQAAPEQPAGNVPPETEAS